MTGELQPHKNAILRQTIGSIIPWSSSCSSWLNPGLRSPGQSFVGGITGAYNAVNGSRHHCMTASLLPASKGPLCELSVSENSLCQFR